jgi:drug/metabolite transporter (DMT)-like permease
LSDNLLHRSREDLQVRQRFVGLALAVTGAVAFSGKAIVVKLAYRYGVDAITLLMYRMLFSLPFFLAMAWWAGRRVGKGENENNPPRRLERKDYWAVVGLGFSGYYLASFLDFLGLQYISASLERLILYLNPTLVLLLGLILFGRRLSWRQLGGVGLSYAGVILALSHEFQLEGRNVWAGSLLVFVSAISYAIYLVYSGEWVKRLGSVRLVGWSSSIACMLCIAQFLLTKPLSALVVPFPVYYLSLINALFCTVIPVLLVMMAIGRIGAGLASQVGMIGPVSTFYFAHLFLDEPFGLWAGAGAALVLTGVAWASRASPSRD